MRNPKRRWPGSVGARFVLGATLAIAVLLVCDSALACTVCSGGQEEASRKAFVGTTALLTFLPLLVVGTVVTLFVRRTLAQEQLEESERLKVVGSEGQNAA